MTTKKRELVTLEVAAQYLGVSPKTVRQWISEGKLTGYRLGNRMLRVDQNELDGLLRPLAAARRRSAAQ